MLPKPKGKPTRQLKKQDLLEADKKKNIKKEPVDSESGEVDLMHLEQRVERMEEECDLFMAKEEAKSGDPSKADTWRKRERTPPRVPA